eukprot:561633-Pleurochrysis_carterae.AAC.1
MLSSLQHALQAEWRGRREGVRARRLARACRFEGHRSSLLTTRAIRCVGTWAKSARAMTAMRRARVCVSA